MFFFEDFPPHPENDKKVVISDETMKSRYISFEIAEGLVDFSEKLGRPSAYSGEKLASETSKNLGIAPERSANNDSAAELG